MAVRAKSFTASGVVLPADQADEINGLIVDGFTKVLVHNGVDATGPLVLAGGPGSILSNFPIECNAGVYVECTGTGQGSVLV